MNATVIDDRAPTVTVTLNYRRDGVANWTTAPMFDDGAHNDGNAGDRIFGAQIPAEANGTIVEFFVSASDGARVRTRAGLAGASGGVVQLDAGAAGAQGQQCGDGKGFAHQLGHGE